MRGGAQDLSRAGGRSNGGCIRSNFFFQAEDSIRDLVRSRGLGDVYKRQAGEPVGDDLVGRDFTADALDQKWLTDITEHWTGAVSYTHLTLPTIYAV